jgi:hypothetical protein
VTGEIGLIPTYICIVIYNMGILLVINLYQTIYHQLGNVVEDENERVGI